MILFDAFHLMTGLMPGNSPIGWLQVDNAQLVWDPTAAQGATPGLPIVKSVTINGQPLDPDATYTCRARRRASARDGDRQQRC